jgi:hypothetical protein
VIGLCQALHPSDWFFILVFSLVIGLLPVIGIPDNLLINDGIILLVLLLRAFVIELLPRFCVATTSVRVWCSSCY